MEPIRYEPVAADNVILVKARGHLTTDDIIRYTRSIEADDRCTHGMDEFIDLRELEVYDVDAEGMRFRVTS